MPKARKDMIRAETARQIKQMSVPRLSTDGGTVRVCGEFLFVSEHDAEPTEIAPLLGNPS